MTADRVFSLKSSVYFCLVQKGEDIKGEGVSGLSSPVLRFDNDRKVRIYMLKALIFDNNRRLGMKMLKVCLDSLLQCLDLIMTEG